MLTGGVRNAPRGPDIGAMADGFPSSRPAKNLPLPRPVEGTKVGAGLSFRAIARPRVSPMASEPTAIVESAMEDEAALFEARR